MSVDFFGKFGSKFQLYSALSSTEQTSTPKCTCETIRCQQGRRLTIEVLILKSPAVDALASSSLHKFVKNKY
jgi:hypothetical protein